MGAINYKTSDYITLGYLDISQQDFDEEYNENDYYLYEEDDFTQIKYLLEKQHFYYFRITLEPGYYSGFSLDIENNFSYCYDDYTQKKEALKELKQIKKFLNYIVDNFNIAACSPGWCTTFYNYNDTITKICGAIQAMQDEIKNTPTYYQLRMEA